MNFDVKRIFTKSFIREFLSDAFVGCTSSLIDIVLFQVLYALAGFPVYIANPASLTVATVYNFLMNRNVTFKSTSNPVRSLVLYALLFVFNTCFTTWFIGFLIGFNVHSLLAKLLAIFCTTAWNFILFRKVIFPKN